MSTRPIAAGVDFSEPSTIARRHAARLASRLDAPLYMIHVVPTVPGAGYLGEHVETIRADQRASATRELEAIAGEHRDGDVDARIMLVDGVPETALLGAVARLEARMLVVGTHGRTGLGRFLLGSVAEDAVREAEVDVLVARTAPERYRRVLVAVTLEPSSARAVEAAIELADPATVIDVLHCWELGVAGPAEAIAAVTRELESRVAERGAALIDRFRGRHDRLSFHALCATPEHGITEWLERGDYDLMATDVGSDVAENIVRHAPCSVLVIK